MLGQSLQPDRSNMAETRRNPNHSDEASVEQFFDFEEYYEGACGGPDGILGSDFQASDEPGSLGQDQWLKSRQDEAVPSADTVAAVTSLANETAMTDASFENVGGSSEPATHIENEPLYRHEWPSWTDNLNAKINHIDDRIEEIDLMLERRKLLKRRQAILQISPGPQQAQASEHPGSQAFGTMSDSRAQVNNQCVNFDGASQRSDLFVSIILQLIWLSRYANDITSQPPGTASFNNDRMSHSNNINISSSSNDTRQNVPVGTDFRDSSKSAFADLSNNAHGRSSQFESDEQSSVASTELSNTNSMDLDHYMPAGLPSSGLNHQCGTEGPVPRCTSDQITMQSSLTISQHTHGLNLDTVQHVSAKSSSRYDQALNNTEASVIIRKSLGSSQPTKLSAIQRQLAKKTGVPEISLGVMCFNTEPPPKRRRTGAQKSNKKDVENVGGSCFLCLVLKKKVLRLDFNF